MTLLNTSVTCNLPVDIGATCQVQLNAVALGLAVSIAESSNVVSNIVLTGGYKNISFGITSSQAGSVSIQRYLDQGATIKQGAAITGSLSSATALTVNNNDGAAFQSLIITISNSSGSTTANLTNLLLLLQSN